jgi:hypothetical protein
MKIGQLQSQECAAVNSEPAQLTAQQWSEQATAFVLANGADLVGITPPDRRLPGGPI